MNRLLIVLAWIEIQDYADGTSECKFSTYVVVVWNTNTWYKKVCALLKPVSPLSLGDVLCTKLFKNFMLCFLQAENFGWCCRCSKSRSYLSRLITRRGPRSWEGVLQENRNGLECIRQALRNPDCEFTSVVQKKSTIIYILPVLTYGARTSRLTKKLEKKVRTVHRTM